MSEEAVMRAEEDAPSAKFEARATEVYGEIETPEEDAPAAKLGGAKTVKYGAVREMLLERAAQILERVQSEDAEVEDSRRGVIADLRAHQKGRRTSVDRALLEAHREIEDLNDRIIQLEAERMGRDVVPKTGELVEPMALGPDGCDRWLVLRVQGRLLDELRKLTKTGLHGRNEVEIAERMLSERLIVAAKEDESDL